MTFLFFFLIVVNHTSRIDPSTCIFRNRGYDFDGLVAHDRGWKKKKKKKSRGESARLSREKRKWQLPWPRATNPSSVRKSRERHGVEGRERETSDDDIFRTYEKKKIIELTLCGTRTCIMIVDNSVQDSFQYG